MSSSPSSPSSSGVNHIPIDTSLPTSPAPESRNKKIVIIGAGPTGLGAATRLIDLGHKENFTVIDTAPAGGLSRSYVDDNGFTWDIGGHVIFSHYSYFDDVMKYSTNEWLEHERESWVFCQGSWVPYPFQNNIHRLPPEARAECLDGLLDQYKTEYTDKPANFEEYFTRQFGAGIAKYFMSPYNFKVWAVPPKNMSTEWMGERVATADVRKVCRHVCLQKDDLGWGPNATFKFPLHGGTGGIWSRLYENLVKESACPEKNWKVGSDGFKVTKVDAGKKEVHLANGEVVQYDTLISTMAVDNLLRIVEGPGIDKAHYAKVADGFQYSSTNVIGLGMKGTPPPHLKTMCWMYFPEPTSPFYRATVFSNYSPNHAPDGCWSLMLEVSQSNFKPVNRETIVEECIKGCYASDLLAEGKDEIVSKWLWSVEKGYPTPFIGRNELLHQVNPHLESLDILTRGRFGAWKYEVANQDHSLQQGVEAVERALGFVDASDKGRIEATFHSPNYVNARDNRNNTRRMNVEMRMRGATKNTE